MATIIQIKRSAGVAAPQTTDLVESELAYSQDQTNDGSGAVLYIESIDSNSNEVIHKVGGKYYTDAVDAATNNNTVSTIVKRDAAGSFSANVITATLSGQATSAVVANTANALTTGRYIKLSGDVVGEAYFDGSGNAELTATVIQANSVALGTDTTGDYVANLVAGTGVTLSNLSGEGATPTIAIGQDVSTSANVTFNRANLTSANIGGTVLTGGGSGFFVDPVAAGTTGNAVFYNTSTKELTYGAISTSFTLKGDTGTDTFNTGDTLSIKGGTGVGTAATDNTITITNLGVTGVSTGYGLTTSAANGSITLNNTGVTKLSAGSGLGVDATSGNVTITNLGVTSVSGTANEIEVSASNASVQIGLPDNVTIGNDLTVSGNLVVNGVVTTINTSVTTVEDPLMKFGSGNGADSLDLGFFGQYSNGGTKFAGLFRDASDSGKFKLFQGLAGDPDTVPNVVDVNGSGYTIATLVANLTGGTVSGLTSAIGVSDGGTGANTFTTNGVLYGQGTSAFAVATGSAGQVLQLNSSGVPTFAGIDGGTY